MSYLPVVDHNKKPIWRKSTAKNLLNLKGFSHYLESIRIIELFFSIFIITSVVTFGLNDMYLWNQKRNQAE